MTHISSLSTCPNPAITYCSADLLSDAEDDIFADLEDSLEELEDGLDVLMILEKAYEKTLRSHVCRADQSPSSSRSQSPPERESPPTPIATSAAQPQSSSTQAQAPAVIAECASEVVPLFQGSSTALVAILEHPSPRSIKSFGDAPLFDPQPASATPIDDEKQAGGAVIRIAHLGDCMGMLVRGDNIVWRTEEMWWGVSHLHGFAVISACDIDCARVFTVQHPRAAGPCIVNQASRCTRVHSSSRGGRHSHPRLRWAKRQPLGCGHPRRGCALPPLLHGLWRFDASRGLARRVPSNDCVPSQHTRGHAQRGAMFPRKARFGDPGFAKILVPRPECERAEGAGRARGAIRQAGARAGPVVRRREARW